MKNKGIIVLNLEEAIEQLQETVKEVCENQDFSEVELRLDLEHAYRHVNYARHIRKGSDAEVEECSGENFSKWSKFPIGEIFEYE